MGEAIRYLAQVLFLIRKEFLAILKDPSSRVLLVAPVLMQSILFGYGATYDLNHVPYAVLDRSGGQAADELLARFDGTGLFNRVATLAGPGEIAGVIDRNEALLVIFIPDDFSARLAANEEAPVQIILDGRNSATASAAASAAASVIAGYNAAVLGVVPLITIDRRVWFNPNLESRWTLMPALIALLSMIQTMLLAALSVAREREQGTFDQLLVTPLTPMQILIGKALPTMMVGLLQSTLILLIIRFWFEIPMNGSPVLLYFGLACFTLASVGIGLSISAIALTMQQAMLYTFMLVLPLSLLSGLLTPVRNMPEVLQLATLANPLRFGIDLVRRVYLEGAGLSEVAPDFVPMCAVMVVTLPLAGWLFRHRLS